MGNTPTTIVGAPYTTVFQCGYCNAKTGHTRNFFVYNHKTRNICLVKCVDRRFTITKTFDTRIYLFKKKLPNNPIIICEDCFINNCEKYKMEIRLSISSNQKKNIITPTVVAPTVVTYPSRPDSKSCCRCGNDVSCISTNSTKNGYLCQGCFEKLCCSVSSCNNSPAVKCSSCHNNFCEYCWKQHEFKMRCRPDGLAICGENGINPYHY